jgi:phosphopantothenoylcysteine decarboxylase/phosphopantothenate--cysteine ligase
MSAAVADFTPPAVAEHKIKKREVAGGDGADLVLRLQRTPDILADLNAAREHYPDLIRVGFAAETRDLAAAGRDKLARKGLDLVVANDISQPDSGFGAATNIVTLFHKDGRAEELPALPKTEVAARIWDTVAALLAQR